MASSLTYAEKYAPAMGITDQVEADRYFLILVGAMMQEAGLSREEAGRIERANLGYYAGYYDHETRLRVERLFRCVHPVLGAAADGQKSVGAILALGMAYAQEHGGLPRG